MLLQYFENFVASKYICYSVIAFLNTIFIDSKKKYVI